MEQEPALAAAQSMDTFEHLKYQLDKLTSSYKQREMELVRALEMQEKELARLSKTSRQSRQHDQQDHRHQRAGTDPARGRLSSQGALAVTSVMPDWEKAIKMLSPGVELHVRNASSFAQEVVSPSGRCERRYENGVTLTVYPNLVMKQSVPSDFAHPRSGSISGHTFYYYPSGNVKDIFPNGDIIYRYAVTGVTCFVSYASACRTYTWPKGQVEKYHGKRAPTDAKQHQCAIPYVFHEVHYVDGTHQERMTDGSQMIHYPDGTVLYLDPKGGRRLVHK